MKIEPEAKITSAAKVNMTHFLTSNQAGKFFLNTLFPITIGIFFIFQEQSINRVV